MALDVIVVKYVSTVDQLADMPMKALGTKRLIYVLQFSAFGPACIQQ